MPLKIPIVDPLSNSDLKEKLQTDQVTSGRRRGMWQLPRTLTRLFHPECVFAADPLYLAQPRAIKKLSNSASMLRRSESKRKEESFQQSE